MCVGVVFVFVFVFRFVVAVAVAFAVCKIVFCALHVLLSQIRWVKGRGRIRDMVRVKFPTFVGSVPVAQFIQRSISCCVLCVVCLVSRVSCLDF